jgi:hypothetical protein
VVVAASGDLLYLRDELAFVPPHAGGGGDS